MRKTALRFALALLAVFILGAVGVAWYFSSQIHEGILKVDHSFDYDYRVVSAGGGRVEIERVSGSSKNYAIDGVWGLDWGSGYALAGRIIQVDGRRVVRELLPDWDQPAPGTMVRLDSLSFPDDPQKAMGLDYRSVSISSTGGEFPAYLFSGSRSTWVIAVHGMNARRSEAYKTFRSTTAMGCPSLTITYRNDEGLPPSDDGHYDYGRSEWPDLEAAVRFARANGASHVILAGYSMGAAIVMAFMENSPEATLVSGLILDAPLLSLKKVIDFQASRRNLPGVMTGPIRRLTTWRFGVDWDAVEYRDAASALTVPVLLFHGARDDRVPVSMSDAFAKARPDIVTYVRVPEATHARSWNVDPARYDAAIRAFLSKVAP